MFTRVVYGDAVIFSGNDVKALKQNLDLFGTSKLMGTASDPSSGGGLAAPLSSIAMNYLTGIAYIKTSAPNTGWSRIIDTSYAPSVYFKQGGNAFGATATLGTTDANSLDFITGGVVGMSLGTTGALTVTSTNANSLAVGPAGSTNPVLQVDSSTASQATGVKVTGAAAGGGSKIEAISSAANEDIILGTKGSSSSVKLQVGASNKYVATAQNHTFSVSSTGTASTVRFGYTGATDTNLTASTEAPSVYFNIGQTRQHATGALALQRDFRVTPSSHSFVGASTLTNAAGFSVDGAPIAGTNATITNSSTIYSAGQAVGAGVTNSYGLNINANTGATNNYSAIFNGGRVGIGTSSPLSLLNLQGFHSSVAETVAISIYNSTSTSSLPAYGFGMGPTGTEGYLTYRAGIAATSFFGHKWFVNDVELMRLRGDGKLGIGLSAPSSILHTYENNTGTGNSNGLTIEQAGTGDALMHFLLTGVQRYTMGIDNSDSDKFKIGTNADLTNNNLLTLTTTGALGLGTSTPAVQLHNLVTDAATNTVTNVATFGHNTSGTPAANYGVSFDLQMQDATVANRQSFLLSSYWTDATDATRSARTEFSSPNGGGIFKWMQFGRGSIKMTDILTSTASTSITGGGAVLNLINTDATAGSVSRQFWLTENTLKGAWVTSANNSLYLGTGVGGSTVTQMTLLDNAGSPGSVGIGILAPTSKLHQDSGNATASYHQFTAGTTTGQTATDGTLIGIDASGNAIFNNQEAAYINFLSSNTQRARITALGSLVVGNNSSALATNATDGFLYISSSAGAPTGTPTTQTGSVPVHVDATNNAMYMYTNGAWRGVNNSAVQGSRQTGTSMSAATAITPALGVKSVAFVVGNGGAVTITASPPITTTGMIVGQELKICGTDNTNTVTYNNSVNLVLTGSATLGKDQCLNLMYAGTDGINSSWIETGRSF